jgi:hypothetical protein
VTDDRTDDVSGEGRLGPSAMVTLAVTAVALCSLHAAFRAPDSLNLSGALTDLVSGPRPLPVTPRRRVLLVLVDGLRADVASQLPFLRDLAAGGARADLWVDPPSFSSPQYVALLTGVPPRDSGVRTNRNPRPVLLDNVPRRLTVAGRRAIEIGDEIDWWQRLFGTDFASTALVAPWELRAAAVDAMATADLTLIHLCEVDAAGHSHGGGSSSYRQAALRQDEQVRHLSTAFGWPANPVMVVTDHGHMLAGGHGGDEVDARHAWMIVSGAGAWPGAVVPRARPIDVAPTLAALLGVGAPANAQGRTLVEVLAVDAQTRAALTSADRARIARAERAAGEGRRRQLAGMGRGRMARAAGLFLVVVFCFWAVRRSWRHLRAGAVVGLWSLGLGVAIYFVVCRRISFSAARDTTTLLITTLLIGTTAAVCAFARSLWRVSRGYLSRAEACAVGVGGVVGSGLFAALVFVYAGAFTPRIECEPGWVAAGPLIGYALFAPSGIAAAELCLLALMRACGRPTPAFRGEEKRT